MRIAFLDKSTQLRSLNDRARPRGGMITSLFKVSDYLSDVCQWDVTVISDIQQEGITPAGVKWLNAPFGRYDALVCNRGVGDGHPEILADQRVLWTHDLPHAGFIPEPKTINAFACTVFMSRYACEVWQTFYRDIGAYEIIPNGVDKDLFITREKNRDALIYASAPNRGLQRLPFIFDCIQTRVNRPLTLHAYSNLGQLHPNEIGQEDRFSAIYNEVRESKVTLCDPVPQSQLAEILGRAGLMILPTDYPEICSNVILQSIACGTPVITTGHLGSAPEWVNRDCGRLTRFQPQDYMVYQVEIIRAAVDLLEHPKQHAKLIATTLKESKKILSWSQVGALWKKLLQSL